MVKEFTLYTDGACSGNSGPGGWAVVSVSPQEVWASGSLPLTTNNEMELSAMLHALDFVPGLLLQFDVPRVLIISDSQWVVNMALGQWKAKVHVEKIRLLQGLVRELGERVVIRWERGLRWGSGDEYADREAKKAMLGT